jgi:hypothetical protein
MLKEDRMQYMAVIYIDEEMLAALPPGRADEMMRGCLGHADELRREGKLLESQMLEDARTAKSVRIRGGRRTVTDGPFAEAKEVLGGFNIIEAGSLEEATEIAAAAFPWAEVGCVEVRPVRSISAVRSRVFAQEQLSS